MAVGNRVSGTVAGQSDGELLVFGRCPDSIVRVESRTRPVEHILSRVDVHQLAFNEHLEYGAAEGFREGLDIVERQMDEGFPFFGPG